MARESSITYEQVAAAAVNLKAQSQKPTARNVREVLGVGSMATVLKFLQQWQSGQVRQSQAIDDTLDVTIVRAISNQIASKVQDATAEATAQLADLQSETDTLITENERQTAELESKAVELSALQEQHSALAGRTNQLEDESKRTAEALIAERQVSEVARVELAKAELRLEAVPRIEAEIDKVRLELAEERIKSSSLHEAAAVANAKLESETSLRVSLQEQLLKALKLADDNAEKANKLAEQLSNEKLTAKGLESKIESLENDINSKSQIIESTRIEAKSSGEEAARLRGQLEVTERKANEELNKLKEKISILEK